MQQSFTFHHILWITYIFMILLWHLVLCNHPANASLVYISLITGKLHLPLPYFYSICWVFFICSKGLPRIILKLLHFYGKLHLESKTALKKHTIIRLLLLLLSCYVNHCEYITTYNWAYSKQDILTHHRQEEIYGLINI